MWWYSFAGMKCRASLALHSAATSGALMSVSENKRRLICELYHVGSLHVRFLPQHLKCVTCNIRITHHHGLLIYQLICLRGKRLWYKFAHVFCVLLLLFFCILLFERCNFAQLWFNKTWCLAHLVVCKVWVWHDVERNLIIFGVFLCNHYIERSGYGRHFYYRSVYVTKCVDSDDN